MKKTYFLTDYDESKGTGTLKQYLNGELKDIDSDVKGFVRNNFTWILSEYILAF